MICAKCNKKLPEGSHFCEYCGTPVGAVHQPPLQQGSPGVGIDDGDTRREKNTMNQPKAKTSAKPWIWIIMTILVVLGCCLAVMGGGLIYMRNQDLGWQDVLTGGLQEPSIVPEVSVNTPIPEGTEQPVPEFETAEPQNDHPAETILAVTNSGIWVVDEQTHKAAQISHEPLDDAWNLYAGMSPDKKFFAFITGFSDASVNPMLVVLDIENRSSMLQLELTGPIIRPGMNGTHGDPAFEAYGAMQFTDNLAWSPDATRLAFVAAREGDSADVYIFNLFDSSIARLTDEAGHAAALHWSPDGQFLQYLSIHTFGTGAGAAMEGVGFYDFQSGQAQLLETPDSNGEDFLAWTDNGHFLIASRSRLCESYNLRLVNVERLFEQVIIENCFTAAAYDPEQKIGMFSVTEFNIRNCPCAEPMNGAGLLIFGEGIGIPVVGEIGVKKFEELTAYSIGFIPQGDLFTVYGDEGLQAIYYDKYYSLNILPEVKGLTPYPSPTGDHWAWASRTQTGLWITENNSNPVELSSLFSGIPLWSQDGQTIYFFENNRLFSASAPQFDTGTLVAEISGEEIIGLVK